MKNKKSKTKKLPASTLVISITTVPSKVLKTLLRRKKKNGKKEEKRNKYTTGGRVDMSKGGRVSKQVGGMPSAPEGPSQEEIKKFLDNQERQNQQFLQEGAGGSRGREQEENGNRGSGGNIGEGTGGTGGTGGSGEDAGSRDPKKPDFSEERIARVGEAGRRAEQIATGQITGVPESAQLKEENLAKVSGDIQLDPTKFQIQEDQLQKARAAQVGEVPTEQVTLAQPAAQVQTPEQLQAAQIDQVSLVGEAAKVTAARGEVSDQAIADAAGVGRVSPIEAATIEIPEGALTERVVGVISPEAKAQAATVAGTELARVTRAKKQLSNAGLTSSQIEELGNDPEALEARLMDLTEEERGIIEGLPVEALVSNQLDTLLNGIENGEIPTWAQPAVSAVEQMLAQRGMSASTVGRDSLLNAIIQSAVPLAQSNAQAIQQSVSQQKL